MKNFFNKKLSALTEPKVCCFGTENFRVSMGIVVKRINEREREKLKQEMIEDFGKL